MPNDDEPAIEAEVATLYFAVEVMLSGDSSQTKHLDPEEAGGMLMFPFLAALRKPGQMEGVGFGRMLYYGERCQPTDEPLNGESI